jgi:Pregnancy-associated plasma protein-A
MRHKLTCIALVLSNSVGWACSIPGANLLPPGTTFAIGPAVANAINSNSSYVTTIYNARDVWNATAAAYRIGGWSGVVTQSDCPNGIRQIGAVKFDKCPQFNNVQTMYSYAYTDTATGSVSFNLMYPWSNTPGPYELDLQSALAHEFGHVLGLDHEDNGICGTTSSTQNCNTNPRVDTMGAWQVYGQTCQRNLTNNDIISANTFYRGSR